MKKSIVKNPRTGSEEPGVTAFLTIRDVAERLRVNERTVRSWIGAGDLVPHRFGRLVRIGPEEYERFVKLRRVGSA